MRATCDTRAPDESREQVRQVVLVSAAPPEVLLQAQSLRRMAARWRDQMPGLRSPEDQATARIMIAGAEEYAAEMLESAAAAAPTEDASGRRAGRIHV